MSFLGKTGVVFKQPQLENVFRWDLPNYFSDHNPDQVNLEELCPRNISSHWICICYCYWRLELILNWDERNCNRFVGLFLWIDPTHDRRSNFRVKLCVLDNNNGEFKSCEGDLDIYGCFGSWNFLPLRTFSKSKKKISANGVLRISCTLYEKSSIISDIPESSISTKSADEDDCDDSYGKDMKNNESEPKGISTKSTDDDYDIYGKDKKNNEPEPKGVDRLVRNLKSLLLEEQSSDVLLKIGDRDFKAHKVILKARSPVFASMFQTHTKENTTGAVDIPDCSASAFEILLLYIYTGSTDEISTDNVYDLYYTADKYQMDDLKSECVDFMENHLSVDNFCEIMTLSLQHSEKRLQEISIEFFCANVKTIIKTVQWQKYLNDYATQANELYIKAINA